jgi:hypothetical protein
MATKASRTLGIIIEKQNASCDLMVTASPALELHFRCQLRIASARPILGPFWAHVPEWWFMCMGRRCFGGGCRAVSCVPHFLVLFVLLQPFGLLTLLSYLTLIMSHLSEHDYSTLECLLNHSWANKRWGKQLPRHIPIDTLGSMVEASVYE